MKLELSTQVADFIARQAPDARKMLRRALRGLESERGDIKALEERLEGFLRLRVGAYRIIFRYMAPNGGRGPVILRCEFAERRKIVYEIYEKTAAALRGV